MTQSTSTIAPAWVALGANLPRDGARPAETLARAIRWLHCMAGTRVVAHSAIHRTAPMGPPGPDYANAVVRIETDLAPMALLTALQSMESAAGRVRAERWGPRTLDLDLLLYGAEGARVLDAPNLTLPHPEMRTRPFVLAPLCDIDPDLILPGGTWTATQWLQSLDGIGPSDA